MKNRPKRQPSGIASSGEAASVINKTQSWVPWIPAILIFLPVPFLYSGMTMEPENTMRYLWFAGVISGTALLLFFKTGSAFRFEFPVTPVRIWLWAACLIPLVTVAWSFNKALGLYEYSKWMLQAAGFIFWLILFRNTSQVMSRVTSLVLLSFGLFTFFVLTQIIGNLPEFMDYVRSGRTGDLLYSTFSNKNFFSESMVLMMPFLLYGMLCENGMKRLVSAFSLATALLLLAALHCMAAWVAMLTATVAIGILALRVLPGIGRPLSLFYRSPKGRLTAAGLVVLAGLFTIVFIRSGSADSMLSKTTTAWSYVTHPERLNASDHYLNDNSIYERLMLLRSSWSMFKEDPVTGCGISDWSLLFPTYGISGSPFFDTGSVRYEHPHNDYVFQFCETGIAGGIGWIGLLISVIWLAYRKMRDPSTDRSLRILLMLLCWGMIAFMTISLFSYPRERFFSLFMMLVTMALVVHFSVSWTNTTRFHRSFFLVIFLAGCGSVWLHAKHYKSEILLHKAEHYKLQKDFPNMLRYVKAAQTPLFPLDMTNTPLKWYEGMAYYYMGDTVPASKAYEQAAQDNPYHLHVWCDLGSVLEKEQRYEDALDAFYHALDINPRYYIALLNTGITHYRMGHVDSALYYLNRYPKRDYWPFRKMMIEVLAYTVGDHARQYHDTLLVNTLNDTIRNDNLFLLSKYEQAGWDKNRFLESLERMK